jgi:hypothetical protein
MQGAREDAKYFPEKKDNLRFQTAAASLLSCEAENPKHLFAVFAEVARRVEAQQCAVYAPHSVIPLRCDA